MKKYLLVFCIIFFVGCTSHKKEAAILADELTQQQLEELQLSLASLINREKIVLSKKAFTDSSEIVIERHVQQGVNSTVVLGRDYSTPQHFRLWLDSNRCQVEHIETGKFQYINGIQCIAKDNKK